MTEMIILGLDIGGANTKYGLLLVKDEGKTILASGSDYFPLWKRFSEYPQYLRRLKSNLTEKWGDIDQVVFVTTAELADCFQTKKEGITKLTALVKSVFPHKHGKEVLILNINGEFLPAQKAQEHFLTVSATNWVASALIIAKEYPNCLLLDIGTTTTDILPIYNGMIAAKGKTDLERLIHSELVYTGLLRTNVATICHTVMFDKQEIPLASELFATSGDVYLLLDELKEEQFTTETADGKPATKEHAKARLARIICADINQLSSEEIISIARQIKNAQLQQISQALMKKMTEYTKQFNEQPFVVLVGSGAPIIGQAVLQHSNIQEYLILTEDQNTVKNTFPAIAVAKLFANKVFMSKEEKISGSPD
jgi:hypothetical protein